MAVVDSSECDLSMDDFEYICRICLRVPEDKCLWGLFEVVPAKGEPGCGLDHAQRTMKCADVTITLKDELPNNICQNCLSLLDSAYLFKTRTESSDKTLRDYVDNAKLFDRKKCESKTKNDAVKNETDANFIDPEKNCKVFPYEYVPVDKDLDYGENEVDVDSALDDSANDPVDPTIIDDCTFLNPRHIMHDKNDFFDKCSENKRIEDDAAGIYPRVVTNKAHAKIDVVYRRRGRPKGRKNFSLKVATKERNATEKKDMSRRAQQACNMCAAVLESAAASQLHKRAVHGRYGCQFCDSRFASVGEKRKHLRNAHRNQAALCQDCGQLCTDERMLAQHRQSHDSSLLHACGECGATMSNRSALAVHMRRHTGEKPFVCHACPYRCTTNSTLRKHVRVQHEGVRAYACELCGSTFTSGQSRNKHQAKANCLQNMTCPKCCNYFRNPLNLQRHAAACLGPGVRPKHQRQGKQANVDLGKVDEGVVRVGNVTPETNKS